MPGCRPKDRVVTIATYSDLPSSCVGTFHNVVEACVCNENWWLLEASQPCFGHIANGEWFGRQINIVIPLSCGGNHCAPDRCLQPIRPSDVLDEAPAPVKELEHQP